MVVTCVSNSIVGFLYTGTAMVPAYMMVLCPTDVGAYTSSFKISAIGLKVCSCSVGSYSTIVCDSAPCATSSSRACVSTCCRGRTIIQSLTEVAIIASYSISIVAVKDVIARVHYTTLQNVELLTTSLNSFQELLIRNHGST